LSVRKIWSGSRDRAGTTNQTEDLSKTGLVTDQNRSRATPGRANRESSARGRTLDRTYAGRPEPDQSPVRTLTHEWRRAAGKPNLVSRRPMEAPTTPRSVRGPRNKLLCTPTNTNARTEQRQEEIRSNGKTKGRIKGTLKIHKLLFFVKIKQDSNSHIVHRPLSLI
jgi:hypothetical protein